MKRSTVLPAVGCALVLTNLGPPLTAASLGTEQRIQASDPDNSDWFGRAVDVSGEFAVVGAPGDDEEATNAGAAYVFRRVGFTWVEIQKLTAAADAEQFDYFGTDVAVERDLIAVGAPGDDDQGGDAGAVYLFEWDGATWTGIEKFVPNDPSNSAYEYGAAVDIGIAIPAAGTVEIANVVVGAPNAETFQGVVFLNESVAGGPWVMNQGRFTDSDDTGLLDAGTFGASVAIRGDQIIAGAPLDDQSGNNTGAAYIFGRTGVTNVWSEVAALYAASPQPGDQFGFSVALGESVAVVGAPAQGSANPGRIFVYDSSTQEFTAGSASDEFGISVAIAESRGLLVVGAKRDNDGGQNAGAAYLFYRDHIGQWQPDWKITASDAGVGKQFGESMAVGSDSLIIGGSEEPAATPGAAYLYGVPLFSDGFESGDTTRWSATAP